MEMKSIRHVRRLHLYGAPPLLLLAALLLLRFHLPALNPQKSLSHYIHQVWQTEDGLPQNTVETILQSRDGYLWLGTQEGLVRFDGGRFRVFNKWNTPQIRSNFIRALFEDRSGNLWIGTHGGGLLCYRDGEFRSFAPEDRSLHNVISAIAADRQGRLWIGTDGGGIYRLANNRFSNYSTDAGLTDNQVRTIYLDTQGALWIGTASGINRMRDGRFIPIPWGGALQQKDVRSILQDPQGVFWIGTYGHGLFSCDQGRVRNYTTQDGLSSNFIYSLLRDGSGSLWIATFGSGLVRLSDGRFAAFTSRQGLSSDAAQVSFEDREGSLWVGTQGGGLNCFKEGAFTTFGLADGLTNPSVRTVFEDREGDLWVGTIRGYSHFKNGDISPAPEIRQTGLLHDFILCIFQDRRGTMWIGSDGSGLFHLQHDGRPIEQFNSRNGLTNESVRALAEDGDGSLWIGTNGGGLIRLKDGNFTAYSTRNGLNNDFIRALYAATDGRLWIGTDGGGLSCLQNGAFTAYTTRDGLSSNYVRAILCDRDNTLWVSTRDGGLNRFAQGRFSACTRRQGLFDDVVYQVLEDDGDNLWMSSNLGIFRVSKKELHDLAAGKIASVTSMVYGKADGMLSSECNGGSQPAGWKTRQGLLYFPTIRGLAMVDPANITVNRVSPPVLIENATAGGRPIPAFNENAVAAGIDTFEFQFTAPTFRAPEKVRFQYILHGFDRLWVDAGDRRSAYYTNLRPGRYRFAVRACNENGVWSRQAAVIDFSVRPTFFQSTVFTIASFLLLGLLVVGAIRWRTQQLKRREKELLLLVEDRTNELKKFSEELMRINNELAKAYKFKIELINIAVHDLKNPLQSILGHTDVVLNQTSATADAMLLEKIFKIESSAERMLHIINELLKTAALESSKMELRIKPVNISQLARQTLDSYRELTELKKQTIHLSTDPDCVVNGDEERLREVLDNLVVNAIKFSPRRKSIWIRIINAGPTIRCEVRDEGPGLTDEDKKRVFKKFQRLSAQPTGGETSTGLGLSIVKHFVELHGGQTSVESTHGEGSTFMFEIPRNF